MKKKRERNDNVIEVEIPTQVSLASRDPSTRRRQHVKGQLCFFKYFSKKKGTAH
jgi:hypothetical protein